MKTLILSDIHTKIDKLAVVFSEVDYDEAVFLGDWFDEWDDTVDSNVKTYHCLANLMNQDNHHFLYGNHDIMYFYHGNHTMCSGYAWEKWMALTDVFDMKKVEEKFKFYHKVDDWLLTHAGLTNHIAEQKIEGKITLEKAVKLLEDETPDAMKCLKTRQKHWFYGAGKARGGSEDFGGILWCDAFDEFRVIPDVNQIFGHTIVGVENPFLVAEGNICLDTNLNHYIILENGVAHSHSIIDLL
jgi:hypothetical protein